MNSLTKMDIHLTAMALALSSVSFLGIRAASADDQAANINCTQAEAMLEKIVTSTIPASLSGDVDKDFATIMIAHEKVGHQISEIETKCGKNSKMQSMAAKNADDTLTRMDEFLKLGTSQ